MATRQNSSNGKQKSPRIQVVLPEDLCERLSELAERESRTVSNMAKVLIQEGIKKYSESKGKGMIPEYGLNTDKIRDSLEKQSVKRLKGAPHRIRYKK